MAAYWVFLFVKAADLHQLVHVKPVSLVGGDSPCGCVGLLQKTHVLQIGHLIADCGRADAQTVFFG
jgi:hypothetical protein